MLAQGGCLCGALRYAVSAAPTRLTICHCRFCQRATGSAYMVEPVFQKNDFALTAGKASVYGHRSEGSGKIVDVHFCGTCGTKLFLSFERFPDVVGIYAGTFDDPNWLERAPETLKHIFLGVAQRGTLIPAGVKTYPEHASNNAGEPLEPTVFDRPHVIDSPHA
jgi:hypothetical protein